MGLLDDIKAYVKANTPRATRPAAKPSQVIYEGLISPNQFNAPSANRFKDSLFGLAGIVPGVGDVAAGAEAADLWNRGEKLGAGLSALGTLPLIPALGSHIVYHGSPHKFSKFDMSKIGTGEGAQAYGHGIYVSEDPITYVVNRMWDALDDAGDGYIGIRGDDAVVKRKFRKSWNRPDGQKTSRLPGTSVIGLGTNYIEKSSLYDAIKKSKGYGENTYLLEGDAPFSIQHLANDPGERLLANNKILYSTVKDNFYKVDIPDEAIPRMLDWDKPLSEQASMLEYIIPKTLRDAYELGKKHRSLAGGRPGKSFYNNLSNDELSFFDQAANNPSINAFYESGARGLDIPVFAKGMRYGNKPHSGRSMNHADNFPELGVSMAKVYHPEFSDDWENTISAMFIAPGRNPVEYEGYALRGILGSDGEPLMVGLKPPRTGQQYWIDMVNLYGGEKEAANALRERGIPGIRYLDDMSRGTNSGTNNYVLFDDELARILEINGQPTGLLSWADEAAQKAKKKK